MIEQLAPGVVWISSLGSLERAPGGERETTETGRSAAQIALALRTNRRAIVRTRSGFNCPVAEPLNRVRRFHPSIALG